MASLLKSTFPKKPSFKTLYQALTEGFDIEKVRSHFQAKRNGSNAFLQGHYRCDGRIETMQQVFYGYSMYEVDGVYYDPKDKKTFGRTKPGDSRDVKP
jgi:hypothetical protein